MLGLGEQLVNGILESNGLLFSSDTQAEIQLVTLLLSLSLLLLVVVVLVLSSSLLLLLLLLLLLYFSLFNFGRNTN